MSVGQINLDKWGALASAICAVHCLLTGVAIGLLSVIGLGFLGNERTDLIFIGIALTLGSLAVMRGFKVHRSWFPGFLFSSGLCAILISHFVLPHDHVGSPVSENPAWQELLAVTLSVSGGLLLVTFHIVNARMMKRNGGQRARRNCTNPLPDL